MPDTGFQLSRCVTGFTRVAKPGGRVLVLTAEFGDLLEKGESAFRNGMLELGLLTVMILALVGALVLVRRRAPGAAAEKA